MLQEGMSKELTHSNPNHQSVNQEIRSHIQDISA